MIMYMYRHCGTRMNCDFVIAGKLFLVILSIISALPVVRMEDEGPSYDVEGFDEPDDESIAFLDDDEPDDYNSSEEYGPTESVDDSRKDYDFGEDYENIRTAERLNRDYVEIPRSTNDFERHSNPLMTSFNGTMNIVVDMLAVVDYKIFTRFMVRHNNNTNDTKYAIRKYYKQVFGVVNSRYSGINDSELRIRVRLVGIFVAQKRLRSPWSEKIVRRLNDTNKEYIDPFEGHSQFKEWLKNRTETHSKYDHAMAFTGYALIDKNGWPLAGVAYRTSNCQITSGRASSLIQESYGLSSVIAAVHELGHAFGAPHDGASPNEDCPANKSYIMAPGFIYNEKTYKNFFRFSPCSIRSFKNAFRSQNIECLLDSVADKISVLPGQDFSPDYQCKDFFGQNSGLCSDQWPRSDNFCATHLQCLDPVDHNRVCKRNAHLTPVLGSPCADIKVCKNGDCLNTTKVLESMKETV